MEIPENGICVLFEEGEIGHGVDRIVRMGTHTGDNQLPSRLRQHFQNKNKDRSIFRKNIGRALLNKNANSYLNIWEYDLTKKEDKDKYERYIDIEFQQKIEKEITEILQSKFSFVVFEVKDKEERLILESKLISAVSKCKKCGPSQAWLGKNLTKEKIVESGLWLVNELYKDSFTKKELEEVAKRYLNFNEKTSETLKNSEHEFSVKEAVWISAALLSLDMVTQISWKSHLFDKIIDITKQIK